MSKAFKRINVRGIIKHDALLLAVKHQQKHTWYCLPGGGVKKGESLPEALAREIEEELGIVPVVGEVLLVHQFTRGKDKKDILEIFFAITNSDAFLHNIQDASHAHEIHEKKRLSLDGDEVLLPHCIKHILSSPDERITYLIDEKGK